MYNKFKIFKGSIAGTLAVAALMLILVGGCSKDNGYSSNNPTGPGNSGGPGPDEVWIQNFAFNPDTLTVNAGTTVTWTNKDNVTHTVTSGTPGNPDGQFNSGNLAQNATFTHTFSAAGTYPYYCIPHSGTMHGVVIVQ